MLCARTDAPTPRTSVERVRDGRFPLFFPLFRVLGLRDRRLRRTYPTTGTRGVEALFLGRW